MKKLIILTFIVMMILVSCSSGGKKPGITSAENRGTSVSVSSDAVSTDNNILADSVMTKVADGLWKIPLPESLETDGATRCIFDMYTRGNYLLALYGDLPTASERTGKAIMLLFDTNTGKLLAESVQSRDAWFSLLDNGYVSVVEFSTLKTVIYDSTFTVTAEYPALGSNLMTSLAFVSQNRQYFVWYSKTSKLMMKDLTTSTITDLGATVSDPAYSAEYNGIAYLLTYTDNVNISYALDFEKGTLTQLDEYTGAYALGDSLPAFLNSNVKSVVMLPEEPGKLYMFDDSKNNTDFMFDYRDGKFVSQATVNGNAAGVSLYSLRNSRKTTVSIPNDSGEAFIDFMRISDQNQVFIAVTDSSVHPQFYMWCPDDAAESESIGITVTDRIGLLSRCESMKKDIKSKYGINVFYGKDGSSFNAHDYTSKIVTDEISIYKAMKTVESVFSAYPAGMFSEMLDKDLEAFNFYLCGQLTGTVQGALNTALGITFTDYQAKAKCIVCDLNDYALSQTIVHELMHVMEDALINAQVKTGIPYDSLWLIFLPKNMNYYYYYVDSNGYEPSDSSYTVMGESNEDNIYFIDAYSKTFPGEDKARIMEYLFKTENGQLSSAIRGKHLIEKCRALCVILRKVFPAVASADNVFWESGLGTIDESVFDSYVERFNEYSTQNY